MTDNLLQNNIEIANLLSVPNEQRNSRWLHAIHYYVPSAYYVRGAVRHEYKDQVSLGIIPTDYPNSPLADTFTMFAKKAYDQGQGLLIMQDQGGVTGNEHTIRFGAIWSYLHFGYLNGPYNLIHRFEQATDHGVMEPMDALIEGVSPVMLLSSPSDDYFPLSIREMMTEAIRKKYPTAEVVFYLTREENRAMPDVLLLQIKNVQEKIDVKEFTQGLLWYMPPYLPLGMAQYDGDIKDVLFPAGAPLEILDTNEMNEKIRREGLPYPEAG